MVGGDVFQTFGDQTRPAGLVVRPDTAPIVAVEIFVKQHQILPRRVVRVAGIVPVTRALAVDVRKRVARITQLVRMGRSFRYMKRGYFRGFASCIISYTARKIDSRFGFDQ